MKKLSFVVLSLMLALTLAACKKDTATTEATTATTTAPAAVRPNLAQFRLDLAADMLEAQSSEVDTIAGATDSTIAWKLAVSRALEQATTNGALVDGTYTAEGERRQYGYEDATVVILNGEITSITLRRLSANGVEVDYTQWTGQ